MTQQESLYEMDVHGRRTIRRAKRRAMMLATPLRLVLAGSAFIFLCLGGRKLAPAMKGARTWWNLGRH